MPSLLFGARIKELPAATLPEEITELDGWMSVVYQELQLAPRWDRDLEIRLIAGNVFTTVGRVTEQLAEASIRQPAAANKVSEPEPKPDLPTRSFCLLLPNYVRWEGEVEVQQRLWVLLGLLLDADQKQIAFEVIEEVLYRGHEPNGKRLQNDVSSLNTALEGVHWPYLYRTKSAYVLMEPLKKPRPLPHRPV